MKKLFGIIHIDGEGDYKIYIDNGQIICSEPERLEHFVYCLEHPLGEDTVCYIIKPAYGNKEDKFVCDYHVIVYDGVEVTLCSYGNTPEETLLNLNKLLADTIGKAKEAKTFD